MSDVRSLMPAKDWRAPQREDAASALSLSGSPVLTVRGLRKSYGAMRAVDGLDLEVFRGECLGLLGPNGAGKSTTLRCLLGLATPDAGQIDLLGHRIPQQGRVARSRVGVVPQADALDPDFSVSENLRVYGRYFAMRGARLEARIADCLEFAGLGSKRDARIHELSGGMKRRLTLARALIHEPEILFLDEPTTGLDPQARHVIWERLRQLLSGGTTIVLTTHFMEEAERLCDRVMVVDHGRSLCCESPQALIARVIEPWVVELSGDEDALAGCLERVDPTRCRMECVGETRLLYCEHPMAVLTSLEEVVRTLPGLRLLERRSNLEDVFLRLTGRDLRD